MLHRLSLLGAPFLLSCAVALEEPPAQETVLDEALPEVSVREGWAAPADDQGFVDDGWLEQFGDEQLEALVAEALDMANPQMRLLSAQVDRAEAAVRLAAAAKQPMVGFGSGLSGTGGAQPSEAATMGFGASWEVDVWGRVQAGVNAADENLRATRADFEFARQSLVANVAKAWYMATELALQVQLAEEIEQILLDTVEMTQTQKRVGQASEQDVVLAEAQLAEARDAVETTKAGRQQARRALEILIGRYPAGEIETITVQQAREAGLEEPILEPVPVGLPSEMLERRPDVLAAERRVAAAFNISEQARLARLPRFNLTGAVGGSSGLDAAIGSLSAGLVAPLYTGGALEAQLDQANADQQAAIASYGLVVLRAFESVETALTNETALGRRGEFLRISVAKNGQALDAANKQFDVGQISMLNVLLIQAQWVGARVTLLDVLNQRAAQRINLHLALGGSFESRDEAEGEEEGTSD